ncbi:DNA-processing protein DprA [Cytobacillus sp. FJAT-54145]|uniref:DNA-processing protein DprA n=1 Tax=Cytobacillus spartinae TaxID=3299023 RepID=A0ABW6K8K2_9BACI
MDDFKLRLIHLHHCRGASWQVIFQLLKKDPQLNSLYNLSPDFYPTQLSSETLHNFLQDLHSPIILQKIRQYAINNIKIISIFDPLYPELLKEIYQPPWLLYTKGKISLLKEEPKLAVVGSREATEYGKKAIDTLFPYLVEKNISFVSGLAIGIDTLVHETSIKLGGNTIGVIAGGLYHIYPKSNQKLALEMMKQHLVVSEYPPDTRPTRWQFPMRNRIISGMSRGTFIIEAKSKSGSLITANYAVHEGREVFALPGNIFSHYSAGTNELIQQGAKLVKSYQDILDELCY